MDEPAQHVPASHADRGFGRGRDLAGERGWRCTPRCADLQHLERGRAGGALPGRDGHQFYRRVALFRRVRCDASRRRAGLLRCRGLADDVRSLRQSLDGVGRAAGADLAFGCCLELSAPVDGRVRRPDGRSPVEIGGLDLREGMSGGRATASRSGAAAHRKDVPRNAGTLSGRTPR
jgi:hypothetical protein